MAQELYNEGRVLGFSAWELFARDALDHGIPPEDICEPLAPVEIPHEHCGWDGLLTHTRTTLHVLLVSRDATKHVSMGLGSMV